MRLLSDDRKAAENQQGIKVTFEKLNQKGHYSIACMVRLLHILSIEMPFMATPLSLIITLLKLIDFSNTHVWLRISPHEAAPTLLDTRKAKIATPGYKRHQKLQNPDTNLTTMSWQCCKCVYRYNRVDYTMCTKCDHYQCRTCCPYNDPQYDTQNNVQQVKAIKYPPKSETTGTPVKGQS